MDNAKLLKKGKVKIKYIGAVYYAIPVLLTYFGVVFLSKFGLDKSLHPIFIVIFIMISFGGGFFLTAWLIEILKLNWFIEAFSTSNHVHELKRDAIILQLLEENDIEPFLKGKNGFPYYLTTQARHKLTIIQQNFSQQKSRSKKSLDGIFHIKFSKIKILQKITLFFLLCEMIPIIGLFANTVNSILTLFLTLLVLIAVLYLFKNEVRLLKSRQPYKLIINQLGITEWSENGNVVYTWNTIERSSIIVNKSPRGLTSFYLELIFNKKGIEENGIETHKIDLEYLEMSPLEIEKILLK